jgi:uncharacterized SAM-binding protein YcdF (DUF218 family)
MKIDQTPAKIIIVLGSPNSKNGRLGKLAIGRANKCLEIFEPSNDKILCTGGFGTHFNTSPKAHAEYLMRYLVRKGVPKNNFLPIALSANTVEDATKSKKILEGTSCKNLTIITTAYHFPRVKLIFDEILAEYIKTYLPVANNIAEKALKKYIAHEAKAIDGILRDGLYY